ncbi:dual 3',5'-cyclic-AMP and -GMP phosphodiesterase 11-like, partial [Centruroides vittatus]|uniref:dual 3',5'-cyclic-AMP and -GMP phosphodiesterase 11-like n=1 Tax=Centruroides vittatus TaxID=120091 RepID=UPI00350E9DE3
MCIYPTNGWIRIVDDQSSHRCIEVLVLVERCFFSVRNIAEMSSLSVPYTSDCYRENSMIWRPSWQPVWQPRGIPLHSDMASQELDEEAQKVEAWLDDHPAFVQDYMIRKATRQMMDTWMIAHAIPQGISLESESLPISPISRTGSGGATPVRKISSHEFDRGGLLRPMFTTVDGTPTFLGSHSSSSESLVSPCIRPARKSRQELQSLNEKELIFELVKDICNDLDVRSLCHKILQNIIILTKGDRCSLFLVAGEKNSGNRYLVSQLFDVSCDSTVEDMFNKEEIRIPWGKGIVGFVAEKKEGVNIPDCYKDARFNQNIDQKTGYTTRSMLCMPLVDIDGEVIGVAQVINKNGSKGDFFNVDDEMVFAQYLQFCGIGLRNAQLYERSQLENKRNQVLLDLARMIFEEQSTIEHVVYRIMTHTQSLLQCQRCQILLLDERTKGNFSRVFDLDASDMENEESFSRTSPFEGRFPINIGITGYVAATGETLNIPNTYEDERFDPSVDEGTGFVHRSILCMPIRNADHKIIGVSQLINKLNGLPFTKNDENLFEGFGIFCGMGIHNTQMYEKAIKAMAKQRVTLEVLSYHATAPSDEAHQLSALSPIFNQDCMLNDLKFNDFCLDEDDMLKACLKMFVDLDLIERFHIDYEVLCRWLLSVKKNYRQVTYHNWRHAFNVAQMMFAILLNTELWKVLGELETMALIIACLCHDLDHRGTNNSFQIKSCSPLAQLYSTSTMEHHHFDQCIMILNSQGNQILSHLSPEEYSHVVHVLEHAILATDLAVYFRRRGLFLKLVDSVSYDWTNEEHRELLRAMLMTACDVAAITKPWKVQRVVAELVASEFFQQGDIEKEELKIQPIDMMNRDKKDQLPVMQVRFIDAICIPVYE